MKKTVQIEYATISPEILSHIITREFPIAACLWVNLDEDFFEFTVYGVADRAGLEKVLAKWV